MAKSKKTPHDTNPELSRTKLRDWERELGLIQSNLASLARQTQRDHYHHAVLFSHAPLPETDDRGPRLYASGHRVTRRINVSLPTAGFLTHFIFDHNLDESDDGVLKGLRQELVRVRSILRTMPQKLVPVFNLPDSGSAADCNLVTWLTLLHWLAHRRQNRAFTGHLQYLPDPYQLYARDTFVDWDESPATLGLDPVAILTCTEPNDERNPMGSTGIVASSLSKPLLYASVNAIELLVGYPREASPTTARKQRSPSGILDSLAEQILSLLYHHHKLSDGTIREEPLEVEEICKVLKCSQPTVSRRFKILFGDCPEGTQPVTYYRKISFVGQRIDIALTQLWLKHMEPRLNRNYNVENIQQFADKTNKVDQDED